ncbi:hypothetical protein BsWGS_14458 [Bradybaena similaris]
MWLRVDNMLHFPSVRVLCAMILCSLPLSQCTLVFGAFSPGTVRIPATSNNITKLPSSVRCSETDPNKVCTCTVNSNNDPFETWWLPGDAGYFVYYDNTARLTPGSSYTLKVDCKSGNEGSAQTQMLTVEVIKNQPPVITNYNKDSVTIDGKSTRQYDTIYTVGYTDPEKDTVTFTMTQSPDLGHFTIGVGDGMVRANTDMRSALADTYTLTIAANDSHNLVSNFQLVVTVANRNSQPQLTNLPTTITIADTAKKGDNIIDLILFDPDQFVPQDPVCVPRNSSDQKRFIFDMRNNQIKVAYDGALDEGTSRTITFNCSWSDGYLTSDPSEVLTLNITDVNKPPVWSSESYFCSIDEGKAGGPSCSLGATVQDPEENFFTVETVTSSNERLFTYFPSSDLLKFAVDYDLDKGGYSQDVTAIMTATDSKGATSTATVKVHVNDINDNTCQTDSQRTFQLDKTDELQQLGALSGTDQDATSPNKDIHFEVNSADPSTAADHILVARNGDVFYTRLFSPSLTYAYLKLTVLCVDAGTPRLTSTSTVEVTYGVAPTTLTSTATSSTTETSIWRNDAFKAIFATLMALLGIGTILLLGSLLACCCSGGGWRNCCYKQPSKPVLTKAAPSELRPKPESLAPIEYSPPVNNKWENLAWSQNDDVGPPASSRYHHYH